MGAQAIGLRLHFPWYCAALVTDVCTGARREPPRSLFVRAAACVQHTAPLAAAVPPINSLLRRAGAEVGGGLARLAAAATCAPDDLHTQALAAAGLTAGLERGRLAALPVLVALHTVLFTPAQMANVYVQCYPWWV
jgi:hypothetical protein